MFFDSRCRCIWLASYLIIPGVFICIIIRHWTSFVFVAQGRRVVFFRDNFVFDADSYFHADIGIGIRIPSIKTDRG